MGRKPAPSRAPGKSEKDKDRDREGDVVDRDSNDSFPASDPPSTSPVTGPGARRRNDR